MRKQKSVSWRKRCEGNWKVKVVRGRRQDYAVPQGNPLRRCTWAWDVDLEGCYPQVFWKKQIRFSFETQRNKEGRDKVERDLSFHKWLRFPTACTAAGLEQEAAFWVLLQGCCRCPPCLLHPQQSRHLVQQEHPRALVPRAKDENPRLATY